MKKLFRCSIWLLLATCVFAACIVALPLFQYGSLSSAHAAGGHGKPYISHVRRPIKPLPHRRGLGIARTHLPTLTLLAKQTGHARANATHPHGALLGGNVNASTTTTIFFDDGESGTNGWATVGDTNTSSYYPNGHDFWNLAQSPDALSVPSSINPSLVSYPDTAGTLPSAYSGTHAWWYGDNPSADANSSSASMTYMGNQNDFPSESANNGGISNGSNSASLISPTIDLTSAPNATLTFATWWEIESSNPAHFDMMYVDVSSNGGSWTSLGVLNPTQNPAGGSDAYPYTSNGLDAPASWQVASVDLAPYVGSHVQIRFRFDTLDQCDNGFRGWFIDDVGVYSNTVGSPLVSNGSPNSGASGDSITISGSGFGIQQNSSAVTLHGVPMPVQSWSNSSIVVTVPAGATSGPLVITINGVQTGAINFTVNASVTLSSPTSSPAIVDSLSGQGFFNNEPVSIYLNGVNGTLLASATTDASGNLPASNFTIGSMPTGNYLVLAMGQHSHITAGTTLSIAPTLSSSANVVKTNQTILLNGAGFAANDTIQIQLDSTSSSSLGYLYCDNNGTCSGNVTMPANSVVQGQHTIIGSGYSGLEAGLPVTFTPSVVLDVAQGGPGTALQIAGSAFAANETVQVYWGKTTGINEGSSTTDTTGNLNVSFNAPTGLAPGSYTITVARTARKPATLTATFQVVAPQLISTGGILSGQPIYVTLYGFQASEAVNISWNANGGQQLTTIYADSTGTISSDSFTPPSAPGGSYTLTATGSSSNLQATTTLTVGPGILLTPSQSNPGSSITVQGGGFTANETVNVYFQTKTNGVITATTDTSGSFSVSLTVPTKYSRTTSYTVYASNTTGTETANAPFSYILPGLSTDYYYINYGQQVTFYGTGFQSNESVAIYWNYKQTGQVKLGTITAASDGTFTATFTPPSEVYQSNVPIAAIGITSLLKATNSVYEYSGLVLTPSSGKPGTKVKVSGGGFGSVETVTVTYQGTTVGTVTTSTTGAFRLSFIVPTTTSIGYTSVSATGSTTGTSASASFIVMPKMTITPTTGPSGTKITVKGSLFTPSSTGYLYWYDPTTGNSTYFGTFTTSSTGAFTMKITAPTGLTSGNTYYIQAYDGPTNVLAQAAFIAQ